MARHLTSLLLCALAINAMAAESLRDPTQPPAALMPAPARESGAESGPVLQSVMLKKGHKPMVIIGGERVELGGRYGESTLVRVSESSAVLEGPGGRKTLQLTPAVEKTLTYPRTQKQKPGSEK